jgi:hypothetical protein
MRSLNAGCKCKMCTSVFSMDRQRWFRCRWWSVDSPLHPRRHRRRCLMRDHLHRPPWMSTWWHHHSLHPLQRQLLVVCHLHQCLWSSGPLLPVVDSPRVPSMLHVDALSSLAIAQMGWPRLPPPMGGPNGPRSGRHVGRLGGGGGERPGKPRRYTAPRARATPSRRGRARLALGRDLLAVLGRPIRRRRGRRPDRRLRVPGRRGTRLGSMRRSSCPTRARDKAPARARHQPWRARPQAFGWPRRLAPERSARPPPGARRGPAALSGRAGGWDHAGRVRGRQAGVRGHSVGRWRLVRRSRATAAMWLGG